jgi:hypothetical protein
MMGLSLIARSDITVLQMTFSVQDHIRNTKRTTVKVIPMSNPSTPINGSDIPSQSADSSIICSAFSNSGSLLAVLREVSDSKTSGPGGIKRYVEIWAGDRLKALMDVTTIHGAFHTSGTSYSMELRLRES